jgi:hypothetical protein
MSLHKAKNLANGTASCRTHLVWLGTLCLLVGILGCNTPDKKKDDPLFGVKPQVNPVPPTTGANPGAQTSGIVPPIPSATSTGSTAAVASLPGGRPLAIGETPSTDSAANPSTAPNVQPIPRDVPVNPALLTTGSWGTSTQPLQQTPPITPNLPPPATTVSPADDAQFAPLQARGAVNQKVDNVAEGVRVTAIVPNRDNSGSMRVFEATARDVPAAVQAIAQQIDQQH